jgi:hydroxymethylbilane synthase
MALCGTVEESWVQHVRLGTRNSQLARWQAEWVRKQLESLGAQVELVPITTQGDRETGSLQSSGGRGWFTKEIQRALLDERCDLAVHSLKDLPTQAVAGLHLAAVPPREDTRDVLLCDQQLTWESLPQGARIGTGSPRRSAQLRRLRPDLEVLDIRGNLDTRLRKLAEGQYEAIVLAAAGLIRLGWEQHIRHWFDPAQVLPASGQAALGIEIRDGDPHTLELVTQLDDPVSRQRVTAERELLRLLQAGCLAPVGALATIIDGRLVLTGRVMSADGSEALEVQVEGEPNQPHLLAETAANDLKEMGADALIAQAR